MINFIEYPKCSTCKKAKKYLDELGIDHHDRHIVEERLSKEELTALYQKSGLPLKRFFNTSGLKYKELQLKDKLPTMTEDEQLELLATDGSCRRAENRVRASLLGTASSLGPGKRGSSSLSQQ